MVGKSLKNGIGLSVSSRANTQANASCGLSTAIPLASVRSLLLAFLFVVSSYAAFAQNIDERILTSINPNTQSSYNPFLQGITNTADYVAIATPLAMIGTGMATKNKDLRNKGITAGVALIGTYGVGFILKETVKRPRPWDGGGFQSYQQDDGTSFPSGSTSVAFATATSLTTSFPKWYVAVPAYGYASAVGYSRMKLGAHYPSDVLAGAVIGSASVFISKRLTRWINK